MRPGRLGAAQPAQQTTPVPLPLRGSPRHAPQASEDVICGAMPDKPTQLDKFKEAARQLQTDDDLERFKERVGKLVRHKPVPEKPE